MKSKRYYIERVTAMEQLAREAASLSVRDGFLRAAEAYRALAAAAEKAKIHEPEDE